LDRSFASSNGPRHSGQVHLDAIRFSMENRLSASYQLWVWPSLNESRVPVSRLGT
jgi:hypothetical protein